MLTARHLWTKLATMQHDYFYLVAALSVLVIAALHSLVDFSFEMPANVILLVAILGMGLGLPADRRKQKADR
jgi:cyanate permease